MIDYTEIAVFENTEVPSYAHRNARISPLGDRRSKLKKKERESGTAQLTHSPIYVLQLIEPVVRITGPLLDSVTSEQAGGATASPYFV